MTGKGFPSIDRTVYAIPKGAGFPESNFKGNVTSDGVWIEQMLYSKKK